MIPFNVFLSTLSVVLSRREDRVRVVESPLQLVERCSGIVPIGRKFAVTILGRAAQHDQL